MLFVAELLGTAPTLAPTESGHKLKPDACQCPSCVNASFAVLFSGGEEIILQLLAGLFTWAVVACLHRTAQLDQQ